MRVLISGFEAFAGMDLNPTQLLVEACERREIKLPENSEVFTVLLPVTFVQAFDVLKAKIDEVKPDVVLAFGLARGRAGIELERIAINCLDAEIADNQGYRPQDEKIDAKGENALFSTLPLRQLELVLKKENLPVKISNSAGTYVCNDVMYRLLQLNHGKNWKAGFIHIPAHPKQGQAGEPTLSIEDLIKATEIILKNLT